jgi:branched-chain amino acid transport system substrate-binding protein
MFRNGNCNARPRPAPKPPLYPAGIKVYNSSTDYRAVHNLQLSRFDGMRRAAIGDMADLDDPAT